MMKYPVRSQATKNSLSSYINVIRLEFINFLGVLVLISSLSSISNDGIVQIRAQHLGESNIRCSHRPPVESPAINVWLNDADFTFVQDQSSSSSDDKQHRATITDHRFNGTGIMSSSGKQKRHLESQENLLPGDNDFPPETSLQGSFWNILRKLSSQAVSNSQPAASSSTSNSDSGNEVDGLVPMKIQVQYDESVYALEPLKQQLIVAKVIPSVVEFFENILSLRRSNTVEKFRISRRCPNNTVYYVRDLIGPSRAYCMDRCEDYAICGEMMVPPSHLSACSYCNSTSRRCSTLAASESSGVSNAQLLLYVSAKQTPRCKRDQTIAYAAHCAQDAKTDRPVAGHANLCPSSISTDPRDLKSLIATVKHELTHVLGFSVSLFAYYRDAHGRPLTEREASPGPLPVDPKTGYAKWSDKIIKKFIRTNWLTGEGYVNKEIHMMVTPTVVHEVRKHFNCSTLEGAELEDQGSDGTSMTHWEKRLFENEAMTGTHTQNSVYSRISLAVLQDTGWYVANFSRAERLEWGQNLGCDFAKKSCKSWIDERRAKRLSIRPYCDRVKGDLLQMACTEDRISKAVCNIKQFKEPLPLAYQNFNYLEGVPEENLPHYGGSVDLADYCPFIQEFTWLTQNISTRGSRCDQAQATVTGGSIGGTLESERNAALEFYGPQTKCFEHGRRWEQRSCVYKRHWHHFGAGCYRYSCQDGHFTIHVGNHSYHCYYPDQHVRVEQIVDQWLYNGTIVCPACDKICSSHKCKSFDKVFVEKILTSNSDDDLTSSNEVMMNSDANNHSEDAAGLFGILDESVNFITESNDVSRSTDSEMKKTHDYLRYKDLLQMISRHKRPPRHSLVCSAGATNSALDLTSILMVILMTSLIIALLHDNLMINNRHSTISRNRSRNELHY